MCGPIIALSIILNFLSWLWGIFWPVGFFVIIGIIVVCLIGGVISNYKKGTIEDIVEEIDEEVKKRLFEDYVGGRITAEEFNARKSALQTTTRSIPQQRPLNKQSIFQRFKEWGSVSRGNYIIYKLARFCGGFVLIIGAIAVVTTVIVSVVGPGYRTKEEIRQQQQRASTASSKPSNSSTTNTSRNTTTLSLRSTIGEWKRATRSDKSALCREIIRVGLKPIHNTTRNAEQLVDGIDRATRGMDAVNNQRVSDIAGLVLIEMGLLR